LIEEGSRGQYGPFPRPTRTEQEDHRRHDH
jgi:hypothetical protein